MNTPLYLGADAGGTGLKFVITDESGVIVLRDEVPTDPHSPANTFSRLVEAVRSRQTADGALPDGLLANALDRLAAVGLACAGIVDPEKGTLGRSPNLPGWQNSDLAGALRGAFDGKPVALANDVNGALYGEYRSGAGRGFRNLVMIALGTGVGGGVLLDGRLVLGSHCGAGEIGHTVLDPDGPPCTCGGRGCLEAWAGKVGLLRNARAIVNATGAKGTGAFGALLAERGEDLTPRDLSKLANEGDATARALFAEMGERLGQAVGNCINILDPDRVLIGGGLAQAGDLVFEPCRRTARELILAEEAKETPIVPAELGPHAAAVGAAWLAREAGRNA